MLLLLSLNINGIKWNVARTRCRDDDGKWWENNGKWLDEDHKKKTPKQNRNKKKNSENTHAHTWWASLKMFHCFVSAADLCRWKKYWFEFDRLKCITEDIVKQFAK